MLLPARDKLILMQSIIIGCPWGCWQNAHAHASTRDLLLERVAKLDNVKVEDYL
jgi:hypothetical protein